jgi:hypothetical protein
MKPSEEAELRLKFNPGGTRLRAERETLAKLGLAYPCHACKGRGFISETGPQTVTYLPCRWCESTGYCEGSSDPFRESVMRAYSAARWPGPMGWPRRGAS